MNTKALLLAFGLLGTAAHAEPPCHTLQCMPDKQEEMEVTGSRIPGYMFVSEQSQEFKQLGGGGGGGSPASQAEVNESGKAKAEKAKAEDEGWFNRARIAAWNFIKNLGGVSGGARAGEKEIRRPDGTIEKSWEACIGWSRGSHGKETCTEVEAVKRPDGKHLIEIRKLLAKQDSRGRWKLVYSTQDTIRFLVDDPQEVVDIFNSI